MNNQPRARFWVEVLLATVSAVLALITTIWPTWIESLFEVSPDQGSGATEWWIVALFAAVAIGLAIAARFEYGRVAPES
jgi:hypothetical protein